MSTNFLTVRIKVFITIILLLFLTIFNDFTNAKGSFGGSRGFSGGGRSFGGTRTVPSSPRSSFGGNRSLSTPSTGSGLSGSRSMFDNNYTQRYGIPRKTLSPGSVPGVSGNYYIHQYGGFSDGLMMGYMMGYHPWYWHTPFYGAFYYSQPIYVTNPDGTQSVYPPEFSLGSLFLALIFGVAIIYILVRIFKRIFGIGRSSGTGGNSQSSFS